jgi:hypothetical protein
MKDDHRIRDAVGKQNIARSLLNSPAVTSPLRALMTLNTPSAGHHLEGV